MSNLSELRLYSLITTFQIWGILDINLELFSMDIYLWTHSSSFLKLHSLFSYYGIICSSYCTLFEIYRILAKYQNHTCIYNNILIVFYYFMLLETFKIWYMYTYSHSKKYLDISAIYKNVVSSLNYVCVMLTDHCKCF